MWVRFGKLVKNSFILIVSLSLAWFILKSEPLRQVLEFILPVAFLGEFIAGMFYTSFLTAPVSLGLLVLVADKGNPVLIALVAGLGAALGDFLIVKFYRDKFSKDFSPVTSNPLIKIIDRLLIRYKLEIIKPIVGLVVIASPFPDELGLMLLGGTSIKYSQLFILTYLMNTLGILLILLPINLL